MLLFPSISFHCFQIQIVSRTAVWRVFALPFHFTHSAPSAGRSVASFIYISKLPRQYARCDTPFKTDNTIHRDQCAIHIKNLNLFNSCRAVRWDLHKRAKIQYNYYIYSRAQLAVLLNKSSIVSSIVSQQWARIVISTVHCLSTHWSTVVLYIRCLKTYKT